MKARINRMQLRQVDPVLRIIRAHDPFDGECAKRYFNLYFDDPTRLDSSDEDNYIAVEESRGEVAGVVGFSPDKYGTPDTYWINWLYVDSRFRRAGIGAKLLDFIIDRVRSRKARKLYLDTSSDPIYEAAVALYERFGFQIEGRLKDYYDPNEDYLIFGLVL